jgi:zinc protease
LFLSGFKPLRAAGLGQDDEFKQALMKVQSFTGMASMNVSDIRSWIQEYNTTRLTNVSVSPFITDTESVITGYGDGEAVLRLVNLYLTQAVPDKQAFESWCKSKKEFSFHTINAVQIFRDTIESITVAPRHPVFNTVPDINELFRVYKQQFFNVAGFSFVIAGSFDKDEILNLVVKYLGGLPASKSNFDKKPEISTLSVSNIPAFDPLKPVVIVDDATGNVGITMLFKGKCEVGPKNKLVLEVLGSMLNQILFRRLREQEKGVYSVFANIHKELNRKEVFLEVNFETAPADVERLLAAVKDELNKLKEGQVDKALFASAMASVKARIEKEMRSPDFWTDYLSETIRNDTYRTAETHALEILELVTAEDITTAVGDCLDINQFKLFKLL